MRWLLLLLFVPLAGALPGAQVPLPLAGDLHGHGFGAGVHVVAAGGAWAGIDAATGSVLWSHVEPGAARAAVAATQELACAALSSSSPELVCRSLQTGAQRWRVPLPESPRAIGVDGGIVVGGTSLHAYSATGQHRWSVDTGGPVRAITAGGGKVFAAVVHGDPNTSGWGQHADDAVAIVEAGTLQSSWKLGSPARSLLWSGGLVAGLHNGSLVRLGPAGAVTAHGATGYDLPVVHLAQTPSGIAAASILGVVTMHEATALASVWQHPRTTLAGNPVGLAWDGTLVSAHRLGWLLAGPATPSANLLPIFPMQADLLNGSAPARVVVSRQGPAATVGLTASWLLPDGRLLPAGTLQVEADMYPREVALPLSDVADGTGYRLQFTLEDALGARTVRTGPFTFDATPPRLLSLVPAPGEVVASSQIVATFADAAGIDADRSLLFVDGQPVAGRTASAGQVRAEPDLPDGTHTVRAVVFDRAGNRAERTWSFTLDAHPPSVQGLQRVDSGPNYLRVGWTTDEAATCAAGTQPVGAPLAGPGRTEHQAFLAPLQPQTQYTVHVVCTDRAGHTSSPTQATFSTAAPAGAPPGLDVAVEPAPDGDAGWHRSPVVLRPASPAQVWLSTGGAFEPAPEEVRLDDGVWDVRLVAVGPGGASPVWQQTVRQDTQPPQITSVQAPAEALRSVQVSWQAQDAIGVTVARIQRAVGEGAWQDHSALVSRSSASFDAANGTFAYRVIVRDAAGHEAHSAPFQIVARGGGSPFEARLTTPGPLPLGAIVEVRVRLPADERPSLRFVLDDREVARDSGPARAEDLWLFTTGTGGLPSGTYTLQVLAPGRTAVAFPLDLGGSGGQHGTRHVGSDESTPLPWALPLAALAWALARRRRAADAPQGLS